MSNIDAMPSPPDNIMVSDAEKEKVWIQFREHDPVIVQPLSPYSYIYYLFMDQSSPQGGRLASYVARVYIHDHLKNKRTIWGHFSGAALVIWLTKNWSSDQLLQEAHNTLSQS